MTIDLCCPVCRGTLTCSTDGYSCPACGRGYPFRFGIADFRVAPPAYFDCEADLETAARLAEKENSLDAEGLAQYYYRLHPEASDELHARHMAHLAGEADQARAALDEMQRVRPLRRGDAVLEVGCGFGQHLAVAAERVDRVAGVDLSLAFLVLARKRLNGRGVLLAAEAERLPFRDGSFAALIAADVIEHLADPLEAIREMGRVLDRGAPLFLSTPNRLTLAAEPHVGLWGVGYLPRAWANRYVRLRRGLFYDDVRPLSVFGLRRALGSGFPGTAEVRLPDLSTRQLASFPPLRRELARLYLALRALPLARELLYLVGPFFHVLAVKR